MAVVLVLGARPSGQTSSSGPSTIATSALRASVLSALLGQRHETRRHLAQGGHEPHDFLALAAMAQREHDIVGMEHAEIAVHGAGGVEDIGARAGRIEGAGDFLADVRRLAGAGDADAPGAAIKEFDRLQKGVVEPGGNLFESGGFATDYLAGIGEAVMG